ncbi:MAG: Na+/H+ antiporter NhaA [Pyrinomonadaceae bacterium]
MKVAGNKSSKTFKRFVDSERSGGLVLIFCTVVSITAANSVVGQDYSTFWHTEIAGLTVEHWINDGLMAVFFLLIGLELERELYNGELSNFKTALLPAVAAFGGVTLPAAIHYAMNAGTATQAGVGIPMATDIAFSLGVLALVGPRVPSSLKVFLVAFAVMDDLFAIVVIAVFYTTQLSAEYLAAALSVWVLLFALNRLFKITLLLPFLIGGAVMWFLMLKSGVHATFAGILLAFAIPFSAKQDDEQSPSHRIENALHIPVSFFILPIFALVNTAVVIMPNWADSLVSANSVGIIAGLIIGKPLGITLACLSAVMFGLCKLPADLNWKHITGAAMLGGIGFTMSIFITNLAFTGDEQYVNPSKIAVLLASLSAGIVGFLWLRFIGKPQQ